MTTSYTLTKRIVCILVILASVLAAQLLKPGSGGSGGSGTGSSSGNIATKTSSDSPYTVLTTNYTILCDATSGNVTLNLFAVSGNSGAILNIKKVDSSSNTCTVDGNASETIDGATTIVLGTQYQSVQIQTNGTAWYIL